MKEIINFVLKNLNKQSNGENIPVFSNSKSEAVNISSDNFCELKEKSSSLKIGFVDGGNSELICANNLSLHFIRIAGVIYQNKKKILIKKKEFYCLSTYDNNKFKTKIFPNETFKELTFDSFDSSIREGKSRIDISKIGQLVRRLAELEMSANLIKESDALVIDGSLEEKFTFEEDFLKTLFSKAKDKTIIGFNKTNSILTTNGSSVSAILSNMKEGSWFYHPIIKNPSNYDLYFVKLNNHSKHSFRIDAYNNPVSLFSELSNMSKDPIFVGYPYGLIEVDRLARISNKEAELLKTRLAVEFSSDWKEVKKYLTSKNAHEILDNIS